MPPRTTAAATSPSRNNTPYARRPSSQPKSTRQQFSACGACRMRRSVSHIFLDWLHSLNRPLSVRCDLKDLPLSTSGPFPACSNCTERGINCV